MASIVFNRSRKVAALLVFAAAVVGCWATESHWWPIVIRLAALRPDTSDDARVAGITTPQNAHPTDGISTTNDPQLHGGKPHDHLGHQHDDDDHHHHAGRGESSWLELSEQARKNIGLTVGKVRLSTFVRTITIPGIVTQRPGWTRTQVVAPLTGIVTKVHVIEGEAIRPGQPLIDLRLTHEDLVQAQVEFLKTFGELDVVNKELGRLRPLVEKGTVPQKALLDRQYEQQKLEAVLKAQRESLLLHGLTTEQIAEIADTRTLRAKLTIFAPPAGGEKSDSAGAADSAGEPLFVVDSLRVESGRLVSAGDPILTLQDYSELYIEGNAFEQDGQLVADTLRKGWKVTAIIENHTPRGTSVPDLVILFLSDQVDPTTRTLHFYLPLHNEKVRDTIIDDHRFINWRFKPGQRTHLRVPVEEWAQRIVLPADAVVQDGAEWYVFRRQGHGFDRRPVRVEYRDPVSVVIAADGSIAPGDFVAFSGAAQMQMALKNRSGGGIDPHAGHNH